MQNEVWPPLPYILLALIGFVGASASSLLPETLGADLPQSLKEGSVFLVDQPFFSYLGWRPKKIKKNIPSEGHENPGLSIDPT